MNLFFTTTTLLLAAITTATPVPQPNPSASMSSNAIAYLQFISSKNPHYSFSSTGQTLSASSSPSTTIPLLVGLPLDLSTDMPFAQAIQIARIAQGGSLTGKEVEEDDARVVCRVTIDDEEGKVVEVRVGEEGGVLVDGGKVARVKSLVCEIDA